MSTLRDIIDACGGYHEYIRGCSVHQGDIMSTLRFSIEIERNQVAPPHAL